MLDGNFSSKWPLLKAKIEKESEGLAVVEEEVTETEPPLSQQLTEDAEEMLSVICKTDHQQGYLFFLNGGQQIQAGRRAFVSYASATPRDMARWKRAVRELQSLDLIETENGEMFNATAEGYDVSDELPPLPPTAEEDPKPA